MALVKLTFVLALVKVGTLAAGDATRCAEVISAHDEEYAAATAWPQRTPGEAYAAGPPPPDVALGREARACRARATLTGVVWATTNVAQVLLVGSELARLPGRGDDFIFQAKFFVFFIVAIECAGILKSLLS